MLSKNLLYSFSALSSPIEAASLVLTRPFSGYLIKKSRHRSSIPRLRETCTYMNKVDAGPILKQVQHKVRDNNRLLLSFLSSRIYFGISVFVLYSVPGLRVMGYFPILPMKGKTSSHGNVNLFGSLYWSSPIVISKWPFAG